MQSDPRRTDTSSGRRSQPTGPVTTPHLINNSHRNDRPADPSLDPLIISVSIKDGSIKHSNTAALLVLDAGLTSVRSFLGFFLSHCFPRHAHPVRVVILAQLRLEMVVRLVKAPFRVLLKRLFDKHLGLGN